MADIDLTDFGPVVSVSEFTLKTGEKLLIQRYEFKEHTIYHTALAIEPSKLGLGTTFIDSHVYMKAPDEDG